MNQDDLNNNEKKKYKNLNRLAIWQVWKNSFTRKSVRSIVSNSIREKVSQVSNSRGIIVAELDMKVLISRQSTSNLFYIGRVDG